MIDDVNVFQHVSAFGNHLFPRRAFKVMRADGIELITWGFVIGADVDGIVRGRGLEDGRDVFNHCLELQRLFGRVGNVKFGLGPTLLLNDDQPTAIRRQRDIGPIFFGSARAVNFGVFVRAVAELVEVDVTVVGFVALRHAAGLWIARVIKAAGIRQPGERAGAGVGNHIRQVFAGGHVADAQSRLLVAANR